MKIEQWFSGQDPETYPECIQWSDRFRAYVVQTTNGPQVVHDGAFIVTDDTEIARLRGLLSDEVRLKRAIKTVQDTADDYVND